jgi:hypothetical protein
LISERKGEGEIDENINDERESLIGCLLHTPYWELSPQPGHVPLTGIRPGTLQSLKSTGDVLTTGQDYTYIFFIQSSLDGHLGFFHIWAIV